MVYNFFSFKTNKKIISWSLNFHDSSTSCLSSPLSVSFLGNLFICDLICLPYLLCKVLTKCKALWAIVIHKRKSDPFQRCYKFRGSFIVRYINNMVQTTSLLIKVGCSFDMSTLLNYTLTNLGFFPLLPPSPTF